MRESDLLTPRIYYVVIANVQSVIVINKLLSPQLKLQ